MPLRDKQGRFCGTLQLKEPDNHWARKYFILDEGNCLLRYFSHLEASEEVVDWEQHDGEINIRLITKIEDKSRSDDSAVQDQYFEIQTCKERIYLRADTKEGTEEWIKTLRKAAVNPSKRKEPQEETVNATPNENDKESADDSGNTERISYETKIIAGVVVRTPVVKKITDSDSEGGSLSGDSLKRSGSTGNTGTIKPIKQGYLTKKGAVVKNWKKRFFKLDAVKFAYYEKETDSDPIKAVNCSDIDYARERKESKDSCGAESNREHMFEVVTPGRTFLIQGSTAEEMKSWIEAINGISLRGRSSSEPERSKVQNGVNGTFENYKVTTNI